MNSIVTLNEQQSTRMSTTQRVIDAAVALVDSENTAREARADYQQAQIEYRKANGWVDGRIDPDDKRYAGFIDATAATYEALQKAKRKSYNARRRLRNAVAAHKQELAKREGQPCG